MTFNAAVVTDLYAAITSHAARTGLFESVPQHEPKSAPGGGLSCAIWVTLIEPINASGLASTSGRVVFNIRVYSNMLAEPQDGIDPEILTAVCVLIAEYTGDFDFSTVEAGGGQIGARNIDLMGAFGDSLSAKAAYLSHDNRMFRVMDVTLPVILNDLFEQAEL